MIARIVLLLVVTPTLPAVIEFIKARRLRALAITSKKRAPRLPDVPTFAESGARAE